MSLDILKSLISQFPTEGMAVERLAHLFDEVKETKGEFPSEKLLEKVRPSSRMVFIYMMDALIEMGELKKIYRVESKSLGGIDDFENLEDIPEVIPDWRTDSEVEVAPSDIKLIYQFVRAKSEALE